MAASTTTAAVSPAQSLDVVSLWLPATRQAVRDNTSTYTGQDGAVTTSATTTTPTTPPPAAAGGGAGGDVYGGGLAQRTLSTLLHNPFFSAGAGLWVLTVGGGVARQCGRAALALLRRRYVVSMEMTSQDSSYTWMMRWLAAQPQLQVRQVSVLTRNVAIHGNDASTAECLFSPCPGLRHWFVYNGRPMTLLRRRNETKAYDGDIFETLEFTTLGTSAAVLQRMMAAAQQYTQDKDSDRTVVYVNGGGRWVRQQDARPRRPLGSVILAGDTANTLLCDVRRFLDSGAYYRELGVPYRRGYLLHGPPGCGKTSLVMALAGEVRLAICLLSLSNRGLGDEALLSLLNSAPLHALVLIEDIDRAFSSECNVTMSGLLNALDGVAAQEGRLVFMTTNHVERLDAALIRPGRADVKMEIGLLDADQTRRMFAKFHPHAPAQLCDAFASQVPPHTVSVAQIQSHLFYHRDDAAAATRTLPAFLDAIRAFDTQLRQRREQQQQQAASFRHLPRPPLLDQS